MNFLLNKYFITAIVCILIILGVYIEYKSLKSEINSLNTDLETYKSKNAELNSSLENFSKKDELVSKTIKQQNDDLNLLKKKPKVIYKTKFIPQKCEINIEIPDSNSTGIPKYLGKIGF